MRFVCLLVEHLPTRVEALCSPDLAAKSLAVLRAWDDSVIDASPELGAKGIGPGDSRRRVDQLCPDAIILPAREEVYQVYHDKLRDGLLNFASAIETSALGELFIEVGALSRAFPSDKTLALHIATQTQRDTRLLPTVGIASNKFTAAQAARLAARESSRALVVPDGKERAFLAPLSIRSLPDPPLEMLRRLHLFGINTLGDFAQLPHAAAALQFGADLAFYHDLACGRDPRPLAPQSPPSSIVRAMTLPEPLTDRRIVLNVLERLAKRLARELDHSGYHAVELALILDMADGRQHTAGAQVKPPSANADQLCRLVGRLLGKLLINAAVTGLTLRAYPLREWYLGARQLEMFQPAASPKIIRLHEALRLLRQRFGEAVLRLASLIGPPVPLPIQVYAGPDGSPSLLRWAGWSRQVERVYEVWREMRRWWSTPIERDYYLVETTTGVVYTLFRDNRGRWYLDRRRG